ncbi:PREDICTED: formin-like protein 8 [Nelumbo nucifera]|uniref:Formin-like protein n=2 Tax=Nelumbo nucifera TaxID=4432 RepID=A0A822YJG7_NELNU|nr:PREDICTED: formin-like protein 8 [Nelumbo nucifera]DAD31076.1 TPA_asm: hypothetical protein HUJ06_009927 [Nelumbo nucifera]
MVRPWILPSTFYFFFLFSFLPFSSSQPNPPQNIETFFPTPTFNSTNDVTSLSVNETSLPPTPVNPPSHLHTQTVVKAIAITAACTLVVAGVFFFFLQRYTIKRLRRRDDQNQTVFRRDQVVVSRDDFRRYDLKGVIVDENGLDVLYWRKLEGGQKKRSFRKVRQQLDDGEEELDARKQERRRRTEPIQEIPLLHESSSASSSEIRRETRDPRREEASSPIYDWIPLHEVDRPPSPTPPPTPPLLAASPARPPVSTPSPRPIPASVPPPSLPPPPPSPHPLSARPPVSSTSPPPPPPPPPRPPQISEAIPANRSPVAPPPSPPPAPRPSPQTSEAIPTKKSPAPPPPPRPQNSEAIPAKKSPAAPPPPPPPVPLKKTPAPPAPPPKPGGFASSSKVPPPPRGKSIKSTRAETKSEESTKEKSSSQVKLKPLHWDKVAANAEHSMVWDKMSEGSFRFDDNLMEALFGSVATNRKSPERTRTSTDPSSSNSGQPARTFILDPRKSQNKAIVLRSLAISRQEILDSILEGRGLSADTLEKLTKIAPTKEEEARLLGFSGNPSKLADAESFLFDILKAVPSAFSRLNAMLFRLNYEPEILQLKESLQTLELACKELRARGLFFKLLEAILKAGNLMNAGTARGNAQAFNLNSLRKLSDVKSTDGKTTLLHFVVQEVVRSEGKRCVINRNHSLGRSYSRSSSSNGSGSSEASAAKEERQREYIMHGLPVVGGLSVEFYNVKKSAAIDYDACIKTCSVLTARIVEIREIFERCSINEGGGFVREMKGFLDRAEEEVKALKREQTRVMELVKRTTEYYQAGYSKDKGAHPLQLFVIIKDFLAMVDQACIDITQELQRKKIESSHTPTQMSPIKRIMVKFPQLPPHFMSDKSRTSSSSSTDSDDDF